MRERRFKLFQDKDSGKAEKDPKGSSPPNRVQMSQLKGMWRPRSPWLEIEIERESQGEGRISEVPGNDVEMRLALGRSGGRGFRY